MLDYCSFSVCLSCIWTKDGRLLNVCLLNELLLGSFFFIQYFQEYLKHIRRCQKRGVCNGRSVPLRSLHSIPASAIVRQIFSLRLDVFFVREYATLNLKTRLNEHPLSWLNYMYLCLTLQHHLLFIVWKSHFNSVQLTVFLARKVIMPSECHVSVGIGHKENTTECLISSLFCYE